MNKSNQIKIAVVEYYTRQYRIQNAFACKKCVKTNYSIFQIILGITLMVLSAVAIIEERTILSLGFGLFSAVMSIFSAGCLHSVSANRYIDYGYRLALRSPFAFFSKIHLHI